MFRHFLHVFSASATHIQDGGIERLRETGGRGRGRETGECAITESMKNERGLGRSLEGLIKLSSLRLVS